MKKFLATAGVVVVFLLIAAAVTAGVRYFSSVTTRLDVLTPKPGVECVLASTADGAALACNWSTPK